jgi:phosphatidylserine/phosphatidylglycerophosphate/cardiolipin synthase-like enzyme/outer membrane protein OmpA-like peptidoglycan-associated protein
MRYLSDEATGSFVGHEFGQWAREFEQLLEAQATSSSAGEKYVNTSTWSPDPLRAHGGTGANVLLRWNNVPADARSIDVVVHLHGFKGPFANEQLLRAVTVYSGLDLTGRVRATLGILPRGRLITPEEVRQTQARLDERARQLGKQPAKARSDVQTFPGLLRDGGAGLESLITGALQWFAQQRGGGSALPIARLILTAHSGGGAALDRLVASHAIRRVCNPDEVHAFDALYSEAVGLKSWVTARLDADRSRQSNQLDTLGGALRVFYRPGGGTQPWSERLGQSLPPASDPLSRFYRIDCTRVSHLEIPKQFGPPLLRNRTADLSSLGPCATGARSSRAPAPSGASSKQAGLGSGRTSGPSVGAARAPLPSDVQAWIRSTDRSAIELVADAALRRRLLQEIDWSREYFPGNLNAQNQRAAGRLAEELFNTMARVTPERRVPRGIRYHDVTSVVVGVPGQPDQKLYPAARDAFVRMRDAAAADGVRLEIISSWRSLARQQAARLRQTNPNAVAPNISAHMYGLAVDLNMRVPGLALINISTRARDRMANMVRMYRSPNYKWLAIYGSRFGWFPYKREPWHWEYNPPGFKERFEGSAAATREFEFETSLQPELEFREDESEAWEWMPKLLPAGEVSESEVNRNGSEYVRWVQQALNRILGLQLTVDGDAGVKTRSAIRSFQTQQGLVADGKVGSKTEAALLAAGAPPPGSALSPAAASALGQPQVTNVDCPAPGAASDTVLDNFSFDKSSLVPARHASQLAALARTVILSQQTQQPVESILIAGHTDPVGSDSYNLQLSAGRAREVRVELGRTLERMSPGITSRIRFEIAPCGERQPTATPESSRRVVIFLRKRVHLPPRPRLLNPSRWAPILSAAKSANASLRVGNAVRTLIDARETLEEMVSDIRATNGERDYIYLLAWDITDNFALIPRDASTTVRRLMAGASARGVQIRAMLWAKPWPPLQNLAEVQRINALTNGAAIRDDETVNKTPMSTARLRAALLAAGVVPRLIPVIISLIPRQDLARLGGSHHQKVLVVKRGETLVAYCGGIDINANRLNIVDANSGQPQHDTHFRIVGPSAWDLLQTFIKRWRHHPRSTTIDSAKGGLRGAREPVPRAISSPARIDAPFGGSTSVVIARTFTPNRRVPGIVVERDIKSLLLAAIRNARRFIYLEDQYLIDLDTAVALNRAIPRLQHLTILILGSAINDMPLGKEYRRDFVNQLNAGLSLTDRRKIGIFQLSTSQARPVFGVHTYVHSKSWVFDDELAVIGSANCNRRGYLHDSEVDAFIFDSAPPLSGLTFAQQYRMRLWKEHLRVPARAVADGVASAALWRRPARPATARVIEFDHRLPPSPIQSVRDIAADKLRFVIDPVP